MILYHLQETVEVATTTGKSKIYKSLGTCPIPAELIKQGGEILHS